MVVSVKAVTLPEQTRSAADVAVFVEHVPTALLKVTVTTV